MRNLTALLSAALLLSSPDLLQARRPLASEPGPSKEELRKSVLLGSLADWEEALPKTPEHPVTAKYRPLIKGIRAGGSRAETLDDLRTLEERWESLKSELLADLHPPLPWQDDRERESLKDRARQGVDGPDPARAPRGRSVDPSSRGRPLDGLNSRFSGDDGLDALFDGTSAGSGKGVVKAGGSFGILGFGGAANPRRIPDNSFQVVREPLPAAAKHRTPPSPFARKEPVISDDLRDALALAPRGDLRLMDRPGAAPFRYLPGIGVAPKRVSAPLVVSAGMAVDSDGLIPREDLRAYNEQQKATGRPVFKDPSRQNQTSCTDPEGRFLNPMRVPYVVVPKGEKFKKSHPGIACGDIAAVINPANGLRAFAMVGDFGPEDKFGEGSIALAQSLGIDAHPDSGGTKDSLLYFFFPGSRYLNAFSKEELSSKGSELLRKSGVALPSGS